MKYIGMNASSIIDGALTPTAMTTKPRVAARLYAGAVDAVPMTIDDNSPTVPRLRPLSTAVPSARCCLGGGGEAVSTLVGSALMRRLSQQNALCTRVRVLRLGSHHGSR